jgi:soluble lytic murein transglycosylase
METMERRHVARGLALGLAILLSASACASVQESPPGLPSAATATPQAVSPPQPAATPGPTPQPAATPAEPDPSASERLSLARRQQKNGDYAAASAGFRALIDSDAPDDVRAEALLGLAQCELQSGAYQAAADALERFLDAYPEHEEAPTACYWLGRALAGAGDGQGAASAYRRYLEHRPLLTSYVQELIGDALASAGDHAGAATAYRTAADAETAIANRARMLQRLARSLRALQRYDEAVEVYDAILQVAQIPAYRAEITYEAGATLRDAGQTASAAARWNDLVATYPETSHAAQALSSLDEWGLARVAAVTRARVYYAAARYDAALAVLRRYVQAEPDHSGAAHYYAALCYRQLGQHRESLRELDLLIETHPHDALVPEAWYQKGESLALLGSVDAAVAAFRRLATSYPQHGRSAQALWRAAQVLDEAGRSWDASAAYTRAAAAYPDAAYVSDARFRAGFTHYLNKAAHTAAERWAELLPLETSPAMRARLLLWLGKAAQQLGDPAEAHARWSQAVSEHPGGFWGLRARDLLAGRDFTGQAPEGAFDPALYLPRGSQSEAEAWLEGWAGPPPGGRAGPELPAALAEMESYHRGLELSKLGDLARATAEWRQIQTAAGRDGPWALYAFSLLCRDQGLYLLSVTSAERLLMMAPAEARRSSPRFLEELAYPAYYADLLLKEAQPTNTDPLLFFALIRQESLFDRSATSRSDARGLTQVIPPTGAYIAAKLGDEAYTAERLWWPVVSMRYGMWYFSSALSMFHDDALLALVAYNAGPGNAARWAALAGGDPDLFFERVTFAEPRAYMRRIYEHLAHYERLYR